MQHRRWREARLSTGFIAEEFPSGFHPAAARRRRRATRSRRWRRRSIMCSASASAASPASGPTPRSRASAGGWCGSATPSFRWRSIARTTGWRCVSAARAGALSCCRNGGRARRCGPGTVDHDPVSVQVRPVPNGFDLMHRGVEARAYVFTEREAEVARLVPPRTVANGGKAVRCPMPGQVGLDRGRRGPGGQGRRGAGGGRGHEDGERAARGARRRGETNSCPARRQPGGRCGDPGIRVTHSLPLIPACTGLNVSRCRAARHPPPCGEGRPPERSEGGRGGGQRW